MTWPNLQVSFVAFVITALVMPLVRRVAIRRGLFDPPGPLKIHRGPIARLGGVALTLGLLAGVLYSGAWRGAGGSALLAAVGVVWILGLCDDLYSLSPRLRLAVQLLAAVWVAASCFGGSWLGHGLGAAGAVIFLMVCINAFNFLDGSDGLAGGVAAIGAISYAMMGAGSSPASAIAAALAGGCVGFLLSNFPPASIFMGDSGSTTLGFVIGFLVLERLAPGVHSRTAALTALLPAAIPLLDFAAAMLRRTGRGKSLFAGDRSHYYDVLLRCGWSARTVALASYGAAAALSLLAIFSERIGGVQ